jgi:hypothetical protein
LTPTIDNDRRGSRGNPDLAEPHAAVKALDAEVDKLGAAKK